MSEGDFPPVDYASWRAGVAESIGADPEDALSSEIEPGLRVLPLYGAGQAPPGAGFAWIRRRDATAPTICPQLPVAGPRDTLEHLLEDLAGGGSAVRLDLDRAARLGLDADDPAAVESTADGGLPIHDLTALETSLEDVLMEAVPLTLAAGANALPAAALVLALAARRRLAIADLRLSFAADPLGALVRDGAVPRGLEALRHEVGALAEACTRWPAVRAIEVSGVAAHEAGSETADELGLVLATTVEYLRWLEASGLGPDAAAAQISWSLAAERDVFLGISKLRAARLLWTKLRAACGSDSPTPVHLRSEAPARGATVRSPWTNLLRATTESFAALVGGADELAPAPFDRLLGRPSSLGRRLARNTPLVLVEESALAAIADPAGGSYYVDALTDALARRAWQTMGEIERGGGIVQALAGGWVHERLDRGRRRLAEAVAAGDRALIGVTDFATANEPTPERQPVDRAAIARQAADRLSARRDRVRVAVSNEADGWLERAAAAADLGATIGELSRGLSGGSATRLARPPAFREEEAAADPNRTPARGTEIGGAG